MIILEDDLVNIKKKNKNRKIVLATGTFDLLHVEHTRYLKDAKRLGDILVVAVKCDEFVSRTKGKNRPIIVEDQRVEMLDSIKYVDYVILVKSQSKIEIPLENDITEDGKEWINCFYNVFKNLSPNFLYYEDNAKLSSARDWIFKNLNIHGVYRKRTAIISTSKIISKITTRYFE